MKLDQILQYHNPNVLQRYATDFPGNQLSGTQALQELCKFFWLSEKHRQEHRAAPTNKALHFQCAIHPEMQEIDDMWHTFLLFTRDYSSFCRKYFGRFIHHVPNITVSRSKLDEAHEPKGDAVDTQSMRRPRGEVQRSIMKIENRYKREFMRFASYVYDHLGEETLIVWFEKAHL